MATYEQLGKYFRHLGLGIVVMACLSAGLGATASAEELTGVLTDAATGTPIAGATVQVMGTNEVSVTGRDGQWFFDLPEGVYELQIEAQVGDKTHRSRMVNQYVPQFRNEQAHVYTDWFIKQGIEPRERAPGLPSFSGAAPDGATKSFSLGDLFSQETRPNALTLPGTPPTKIRVGRRREPTGSGGCTDSVNPIIAIEEVDLDDYVKGVLPPEIGVFQSIPGVSEVYKAFAIAAKSYGLYFVLYYGENNRRSLGRSVPPHNYNWFHIDDTACNQRYTNERLEITTAAANAVAHKVMTKKDSPDTVDKYEYAASCGKHGSRPAYQTALVADKPPVSSCVGTWCGHNSCAAHEVNPAVPGAGQCLVRGICQWGAASWGEAGKNYTWILEHYQPNLGLRDLGPAGPPSVQLTGYAYTDEDDISGSAVSGVEIELSDGQTTTTNGDGQFNFATVLMDLGTVEITARKSGYQTSTRDKDLEANVTNWASIQITPGDDPSTDPDPDPQPEPDAGPSEPDSGTVDPSDIQQEDTGSSADIIQERDSDSLEPEDGSGDEETRTSLGPILQISDGSEPAGCGCAATPGDASLPGGLAGLILWMGWLFYRRKT